MPRFHNTHHFNTFIALTSSPSPSHLHPHLISILLHHSHTSTPIRVAPGKVAVVGGRQEDSVLLTATTCCLSRHMIWCTSPCTPGTRYKAQWCTHSHTSPCTPGTRYKAQWCTHSHTSPCTPGTRYKAQWCTHSHTSPCTPGTRYKAQWCTHSHTSPCTPGTRYKAQWCTHSHTSVHVHTENVSMCSVTCSSGHRGYGDHLPHCDWFWSFLMYGYHTVHAFASLPVLQPPPTCKAKAILHDL